MVQGVAYELHLLGDLLGVSHQIKIRFIEWKVFWACIRNISGQLTEFMASFLGHTYDRQNLYVRRLGRHLAGAVSCTLP